MKPPIRLVAIVFAFNYILAPIFATPQAAAQITCTTIAEGLLTHSPVSGINLPMADKVLLVADVPGGGHPVSLEMMEVPRVGGSWTKCQAGVPCGDAIFPAGTSISSYGGVLADGSMHYGALVEANWHFSNGVGFYGDTFIRLAVTYTINAEVCISQQSWELAANQNFPMALIIPEGKTLVGFNTFATEIPPSIPVWHTCDVWKGGGLTTHDACVAGPPGAIGFILGPINDLGAGVPVGQARGFENLCSNASGHLRRACKVQILYK
jgi:hypothetical protein